MLLFLLWLVCLALAGGSLAASRRAASEKLYVLLVVAVLLTAFVAWSFWLIAG